MKIMAVGTLKALTPEQRQTYLPKEVPATLQLYLDGKMEQFWLRDQEKGGYLPDECRVSGRSEQAAQRDAARRLRSSDV